MNGPHLDTWEPCGGRSLQGRRSRLRSEIKAESTRDPCHLAAAFPPRLHGGTASPGETEAQRVLLEWDCP